ncbi:hypothetical protein N7922_12250 [Kosakonia sp. ML.JS2a]|uniref:hypothetical protein n=1 Tax=Kosakonia sp. ML.JS2a TaxID=2980557 RepID=UPI0021DB1AD8|nr:hypothetical protein [Kosakonia sp. ML.JS2a]UXY13230.1 hypothetical protein N7922_12250 [Kosakonia sp. ML.JS2a]
MKEYVFYINEISVNVYEKDSITPELKQELKAGGFNKMPYATTAEDEAAATDKMLHHFKENTDMLKEFAKDYAISYSIFAAIYALSS